MQLMLLEQQNKKRLMMARQEQDSASVPQTLELQNWQKQEMHLQTLAARLDNE